MKKIEFVNGTTIDGAKTFNDMQNNVEEVFNGEEPMESIVVEEITSSNLFNPNDVFFKNWLDESGQPKTGNEKDILTNFIKVKPNTKYTISGFGSTEQYLIVVGYSSSKTFNSMLVPSQASGTQIISFTTNTTDEYIRCAFSDVNMGSETLQIEKGEATPYKPHKKYGYNSQESMGKIVVDDISCKNKFDINTMVEAINTYRNFQDGILVALEQFNSLKIPVNPNTIYSFSTNATAHSNLCFFDSSMNYISGLAFDNENIITTPNNCYYITMAVKNDYTWCQLEKDDKVTPYTPYKRFDSTPIINDGALKLKEGNIIPITPNVGSNYDAYGNSYYYKVGTKVHVHLGLSGLTPGNGNVIFSIPKGFRPLTIITAVGVGQGLDDITSLQASLWGDITVYSKSQYALFDYEYDAFN